MQRLIPDLDTCPSESKAWSRRARAQWVIGQEQIEGLRLALGLRGSRAGDVTHNSLHGALDDGLISPVGSVGVYFGAGMGSGLGGSRTWPST